MTALTAIPTIPRFVAVVAVSLGAFDILRAVAHTVFAGHAASEIAGLDLTGPTGRDQLVLMVAFGASNFITAAALILAGLTSRLSSLILLAVIPIAYVIGGLGLQYWEAGLEGQGVFPGEQNMRVYISICLLTVTASLAMLWRGRRSREAAAG